MNLSDFLPPSLGQPSAWGPGQWNAGREPSTDHYDPAVNGRRHEGQDTTDPCGNPLFATADGEVIWAGYNTQGSGHTCELLHRDVTVDIPNVRRADGGLLIVGSHIDVVSRAFHLQEGSVLPRRGDRVTAGQTIARTGNTYGYACHLHYELRVGTRFGVSFDPKWLWTGEPPDYPGGDMTVVELIQQSLADAGYDPGPIDGLVGSRTQAALTQAFTDAKQGGGVIVPPDLGPASVYRVTIQQEEG